MNSIWTNTISKPHFETLNKDGKTEVLIIGGGMAGMLCAYLLHQSGTPYVLVEADSIGSGITKNTTAKITAQHGLIYDRLIRSVGIEKARMYLDANLHAIEQYEKLCKELECDFEKKSSYVYSIKDKDKIVKEIRALDRINYKAEFRTQLPLPFSLAGAVQFENQAQFHPLMFIAQIAEGLNIYEHTMVKEIDGHKVITNHGTITADQIIVTTHFPIFNKRGSYFLKMYQHRSYVIALENAPNVDGMYVDEAMNGMSFRNYQNLLFIGGGDHRTGKEGGNYDELRCFAKRYYPLAKERYFWATQDCMTLDSIPYIGQYSKHTPNIFVATGFNKWGMTNSMVSAMILVDMVLNRKNEYADVYSPSRSMLKPQLFINGWESMRGLISFKKRRCPHLGCALHWNRVEHTWDCSCHGSRFTKQGELIDNPAKKNAKV